MAHSRYEYVKNYELEDRLLPGCWIVVRVDGKGFTRSVPSLVCRVVVGLLTRISSYRFSELHKFEKPNDKRALDLMDESAKVGCSRDPGGRLAGGQGQ